MKDIILKKIAQTLIGLKMYNQSAEEAYREMINCSARCFNNLSAIYHLTEEEEKFVWSDQAV